MSRSPCDRATLQRCCPPFSLSLANDMTEVNLTRHTLALAGMVKLSGGILTRMSSSLLKETARHVKQHGELVRQRHGHGALLALGH